MSSRASLSALVVALSPFLALACGGDTGSGKGGSKTNNGKPDGPNGIPTGTVPVGSMTPPVITLAQCGDGTLNQGEQCDDKNRTTGDGCGLACLIEDGYTCPTPGAPCSSSLACGDGTLGSGEACDDGNTTDADGCAANCTTVDPGWQCRVPGKKCVPLCGDGVLTASENCDDSNAVSGDGCSSTCLTEPGWSCAGAVCTKSVCGNGMVEVGESCDKGAENGLFYGDATGCSKTCTSEPVCRNAMGVTQACSTACGDGNIDNGEMCDDGNQNDNDGCSKACTPETGFMCTNMEKPDTVACPSNPALQCLVLPVIYRDFESHAVAGGGHPDFFYLGAPASGGRTTGVIGTKTACVPNASGTKLPWMPGDACTNSDAVGPCSGIASATLNAMGKPTLAKDTCPCAFTDWDRTGILTGVPGVQECYAEGEAAPNQRQRIEANVKVVQDAESFAQWYTKSSFSTEVRGTLELAQTGTQFQYSSSTPGAAAGTAARTVYQDLHDICLGTASPLQSGFFPLEDVATATKLCNLWPYWNAMLAPTAAGCLAAEGNPIYSQWDPLALYGQCPMEGMGGPVTPVQGVPRNFYFTTEARYLFRYTAQSTLAFYGDDDVWVYINGKLALDLGAPHERLQGMVAINEAAFGLEVGRIYEIAVFHADRHPRESNYQLTLSGFATQGSLCEPRCGDGIVTASEECDDGAMNMDGIYGGCTTSCKFGPFCGDGAVDDVGGEVCDNGRDNGGVYGRKEGCTTACMPPRFCGDGFLDGMYNEQCDGGVSNGTGNSQCTAGCTVITE
jgi:fibro-slime domain-containing protein